MDFVMRGGAVKCKKVSGKTGTVEGVAVRHTGPDETDCVDDYFTRATDLGTSNLKSIPLMVDHGQDPVIGKRILANLSFWRNAEGLHVKGTLDLSDPISSKVFEVAAAGDYQISTSSVWPLIEKVTHKFFGRDVNEILRWHVAEASVTAFACDVHQPRVSATPLKHLKPIPLSELISMSTAERFQWEKRKTAAQLQRALDEGEELSPEVKRQWGLIDRSWIAGQRGRSANRDAFASKCAKEQREFEEMKRRLARYESEERTLSQFRGRRLSMKIPM